MPTLTEEFKFVRKGIKGKSWVKSDTPVTRKDLEEVLDLLLPFLEKLVKAVESK